MTDLLSIALQAFPPPDKNKDSLQYLIARINAQRGSFRNVTEQSLLEEIRQSEDNGESSGQLEVSETKTDVGEDGPKKEDIATAREEMLKQVAQAQGDTSLSLDFISLLLTTQHPTPSPAQNTAQSTLSPFVRAAIPPGTLGAAVVQAPSVSEIEKQNEDMVAIGWRMQSLNGAADRLLSAATRLEGEMEKEARWWGQVMKVKEEGWGVQRLGRGRGELGVRFGFAEGGNGLPLRQGARLTDHHEAHADFRDRGLAVLRRDDEGNLILDRGLRSKGDRKLCVRILQQGNPVVSNLREAAIEASSVENETLNARNSIFDEELHHELDRETRNLVNQGVRCINDSIVLPYESNKQIEISLVPREEGPSSLESSSDPVPVAIATALRILLSQAHRQNLRNRSEMPAPLRENKVSRPVYALLKPILEYLQHRAYVTPTQALLDDITKTLAQTGVGISTSQLTSPYDFGQLMDKDSQGNSSTVDNMLSILTSPLLTSWTIHIPSASPTTITLEIHTAIQPPHFGTTFHITMEGLTHDETQSSPSSIQPELFTTSSACQSHMLHVITLAIQRSSLSELSDWSMLSAHEHSIVREKSKKQGRDIVTFALRRDRLNVSRRAGSVGDRAVWSWLEGEEGEKRGLVDVMKSI